MLLISKQIVSTIRRNLFMTHEKFNQIHAPVTSLTEDELAMKTTVSKLCKEQLGPHVREMERAGKLKPSVINMLFENGLMGIEIDSKYGGVGSNFMTTILCIEEISKVDPAVAIMVDVQNTLVANTLKKFGTETQKNYYLPLLATSMSSSFALSEASSGSDAFALQTTAKACGDDFLLNGTKMWISNSDIAGLFLIMANAKPEIGHKGITCFLVDANSPGLTIGKPERKLGLCASGTCSVILDDVRVPKSAILGDLGQGYKIAAGFINESRVGIGAQMLGIAQGCFDATIPYTFERRQFGKQIFDFQSLQHQIAQIATQIECVRVLTYNSARLVEVGLPIIKEAAMVKYFSAEVAQQTCIKCIDWMGAVGITKDFIQEKFYRDCKAGSIYEGTYNIQLNTIAKYIRKEYEI